MRQNKVFIIAEAGVNHNGSLDIAKQLIDVAVEAGADAVKFQTFQAKNLATEFAPKAGYQEKALKNNNSQYDLLKKLELSLKDHIEILEYCNKKSIIFLSTPFDTDSIKLLESLKLQIYKIPSGEINNLPYLRHIGSLSKKVFLSTGMSSLQEVKSAVRVLILSGTLKENITVLHANTMYPTPIEDVNLNAMLTIKKSLDISVGYSDHTLGFEVDIAAVAMGASVIEKHFTLNRNMEGPDHNASLCPSELKDMVHSIRNIELAMGDGVKKVTESERPNLDVVRKSIVAKKAIKKGEAFTEKNITTKRPGTGITPWNWDSIIGQIAKKDYQADDLL